MKRSARRLSLAFLLFLFLLSVCPGTLNAHAASGTNQVEIKLKVVLEPYLPPYQFLDESGQCVGIHIDILNAIAQKNNMTVEYLPMEDEQSCLAALKNGSADLVLGIIKTENQNPIEGLFTDAVTDSTICAIASNSVAEKMTDTTAFQNGYRAVFEYGTIGYGFMRNMGSSYVAVSNQKRVGDYLQHENHVDIAIGIKNSLLYQLNENGAQNNYTMVKNYMGTVNYSMLLPQGNNELSQTINTTLSQMRVSGEYEQIMNRWNIDENASSKQFENFLKQLLFWALLAMTGVGIVMLINLRINNMLKKQVHLKTAELRAANRTLERQVIQARNDSELRNRIVETNPCGFVFFDRSGDITLCNRSACHMLDTDETILCDNVKNFSLLDQMLRGKMEPVLAGKAQFTNELFTQQDPLGVATKFRYSIYPICEYDEICGAIITFEDITEDEHSKELQFDQEKIRILNQTVAGIAHEIRNPLMSIKTFAQLIQTKKNSESFLDSFSKYVPQEAERVNRLISSLIDYTRPQKGCKELVNIQELVTSCAFLAEPIVASSPIVMEEEIQDGLSIFADRNQLKQVLINIMLNGLQSMQHRLEEDASLTGVLTMRIRAFEDPDYTYLQIADEGTGMSPEIIKKATEPFFTTKAKGTGMGLALTKQYVQENGGELLISSEVGSFTKITLRFRRQEHG